MDKIFKPWEGEWNATPLPKSQCSSKCAWHLHLMLGGLKLWNLGVWGVEIVKGFWIFCPSESTACTVYQDESIQMLAIWSWHDTMRFAARKGRCFRWRTRRHWSGPSSVAESKLRRLCEGVSSLESMCRGPCELLGYRTQHTYLLLSPFASLGSERLGSIPEVWSILKYEICLYSIFRIGGLHFVLEQLYVSSLRFGSAAIFSRCRSWKSWCLVWMDHSAKLMASFVAVPMACWCLFLKSADTIPKMPVWPNISGFS